MEKLFIKNPNVYGRIMEVVSYSPYTVKVKVKDGKSVQIKKELRGFKLKVFMSNNKAIRMYISTKDASKVTKSKDVFDILKKKFISEEEFLQLFPKQNQTFKKRYLEDYRTLLDSKKR